MKLYVHAHVRVQYCSLNAVVAGDTVYISVVRLRSMRAQYNFWHNTFYPVPHFGRLKILGMRDCTSTCTYMYYQKGKILK